MADTYDVFISYSHSDRAAVAHIAEALRSKSLRIWFDESDIAPFAPLTATVKDGLSASRALLAYYSKTYPQRRACQWELTSAFLAAQQEGDPRRRILVVNPEPYVTHVKPLELRDALLLSTTALGPDHATRIAASVAKHLATIDRPFGEIRSAVQPPWFGAAAVGSTRFLGRTTEMWAIHSALRAKDAGMISGLGATGAAQVSGLGGMGKSLIAEEYAKRFGAAYPGGVFWLRADRAAATDDVIPSECDRQSRLFLEAMGIAADGLSAEQARGALANELERRGGAYLWIVDDVPAGLSAIAVRGWFAPHPLGSTLLTTRSKEYAAFAKTVELGPLSHDEALELLTARRTPHDDDEQKAAQRIVDDLGQHPLALDVAGGALYISAGAQSFAGFRTALEELSADELEFAASLSDALPNGHEKSIAATLLRSLRMIGDDGRMLSWLFAGLASHPVPVDLLVATTTKVMNDPAASRRTVVTGLNQLHGVSLVELDGGRATMHALVKRTVRFNDARAVEVARGVRMAVVDALSDALRNSGEHASAQAETYAVHARELAANPQAPKEWELLQFVAVQDIRMGAYAPAVEESQRVAAWAQGEYGVEHPFTLAAMINVGVAFRNQGRYADAASVLEQLVPLVERVLGAEADDALKAKNNLAHTLDNLGQYPRAIEILESLIPIQRRKLGPDDPETLKSEHNLAAAYYGIGQYRRCIELLEHRIEEEQPVNGEIRLVDLAPRQTYGLALNELGDHERAIWNLQQVVKARSHWLGAKHPETLNTLVNLGAVYSDAGQPVRARELYERALEGLRASPGPEHPITLRAMNDLGLLLHNEGRYTEAEKIHRQTLDARLRTLGAEHVSTLTSMNNLALTLHELGQLSEACDLYKKVLDVRVRILGLHHPHTSIAAANLWHALDDIGEHMAALVITRDYLSWMVNADPTQMSAQQRVIRKSLIKLLQNVFPSLRE